MTATRRLAAILAADVAGYSRLIDGTPVEACLAELLDRLGIVAAHFAARGSADLKGFLAEHPKCVASLTVLCPAVLDTRTLSPLGERLLVVTGDRGPGARRTQTGLSELPQATAIVLDDYAGLTWSDIAAERGDSIAKAMEEFLSRGGALPSVQPSERHDDIALANSDTELDPADRGHIGIRFGHAALP